MLRIIVGSKNPVKINATKQAISAVLATPSVECLGIDAPSGVADQPMNSIDTLQGAVNRVQYCQQHHQADYYVAIEGGVDKFETGPATFAYIVISNGKNQSVGRSSMMPIPPRVYQALQNGEELGHVMDRLFNTDNVKQKQGAIGLLTNAQSSREIVYTQATILAMAPFVNPQMYFE